MKIKSALFTGPELETGRLLFAQACEFVATAPTIAAAPPPGLPEIAFAGRSNVGKSSLLNALAGRLSLARVSQTPGRTRQLGFYNLGRRLMLVDLPGHGFAAASKADIAQWTILVRDYLANRSVLRRVCLLIDARHGVKPIDEELMEFFAVAGLSYQLVLTKIDKASADDLAARRAEFAALKEAALHPVQLATSAETGAGIEELRAALAALSAPHQKG